MSDGRSGAHRILSQFVEDVDGEFPDCFGLMKQAETQGHKALLM
jgi:hypothetical protein